MTTTQREPVTRVAVLVPTYNERDNLPGIVARVRASVPDADVFVLDDGSPDGTGQIADDLASADAQVHVVHRTAKEGLGKAYLAGFDIVLERGYDAAVEMDADGSHLPEQPPSARPTSSSEPAGSRAARCATGRFAARSSPSERTSTRRCSSGCRSTTRRPATASTA
jgi:hypothetical protein